MKNTKTVSFIALCLLVVALLACNATTANISSFKLAKDKEGKETSSDFKAGDVIYGLAQISNNGGEVKVKFRLVAEDVKGMTAGDIVKGSEVSVDIKGDEVARYTLTVPPTAPGGNYKVIAEMLYNDEKKDEKSASLKLSGE